MAAREHAVWTIEASMSEQADERVESLVREHARFVYRLVYSLLRNHHDAEDTVQETFLRVCRHRSSLKHVQNPRAWIACIAWRSALTRRRESSAQAHAIVDLDELKSSLETIALGPEEAAGREQMRSLLEKVMRTLPEELRNPLILSTVEDIRSPEISAILGIPEATVRTRLFRARQLLREKLTALIGGPRV
ncbi:MAG: RNA polymerase sigma factor [Acidobacteriota bacterium]